MFKRASLILLSINALTSNTVLANSSQDETSYITCVVWGSVVIGAGTVVWMCAPVVIPIVAAKAVVAATTIKAGCVVVGTKAVAAGAAVGGAIKTGVVVVAPIAKTFGPVVLIADYAVTALNKAPEIQLSFATAAESYRLDQAKKDFEKCMNKHAYPNPSIVPEICKKEQLFFALLTATNIEQQSLLK